MNAARYAFRTRPFKTRVVHHEVPVPKKETANKKGKKSNNAQPMTLKSLPDPFQQWQQNLDYQAINGYAQQQPVGFMPQPHLQHPGALPPQGQWCLVAVALNNSIALVGTLGYRDAMYTYENSALVVI